jgi:predicted Zn-dependent protease
MTDRLDKLQVMLQKQPDDPFLLYALAMELRKAGRVDEAAGTFQRVIEVDPLYCYAYYQLGQLHASQSRIDAAKKVLTEGIAAAGRKGDGHARTELQAALELLE